MTVSLKERNDDSLSGEASQGNTVIDRVLCQSFCARKTRGYVATRSVMLRRSRRWVSGLVSGALERGAVLLVGIVCMFERGGTRPLTEAGREVRVGG